MNAMKKSNPFDTVIHVLDKICSGLAALFLAIAVGSSVIQVVSRTVLGSPLTWTEEVARFAGIWMTMFAMGPIFKERGHIGVDLIYNKFPNASKKYVDIINDLITIAVMLLFTVFAVILLKNGARTSSPALRVPMSVIYSGVVIGGGCSVLFAIYAAIGHTKSNFFGQSKEVS